MRANAGDVIFFVAMCDRIATCLAGEGDTDPVDVRRSKAVGILAQPALALAMLQRHAALAPVDPDEPLPDDPAEPECPTCGGPGGRPAPFPVDPDRLRPQAVLYVRISEEALRRRSRGRRLRRHRRRRARSGWSPCSRCRTCSGTAG